MTSISSQNILSKEDFKAVLVEASSLAKPYFKTSHMPSGNQLLPRAVSFKGRRDRCLRGDIAA